MQEWVLVETVDDLPRVTALPGKAWFDVMKADHRDEVLQAVRAAVKDRVGKDYLHQDRKAELDKAYKQLMRDRFALAGQDDQDEEYAALMAMRPMFLKNVLGLGEDA